MQEVHMENEEKKQTGLWVKQTQKGDTMLTGSMGNETIMVFKNNFKTEEKHPDYIIKFKPKNIAPMAMQPTTTAQDGFKAFKQQQKPTGSDLPF